MRAMSLDTSNKDDEDNELHQLRFKMDKTTELLINLSKQMDEIKESVCVLLFDSWFNVIIYLY